MQVRKENDKNTTHDYLINLTYVTCLMLFLFFVCLLPINVRMAEPIGPKPGEGRKGEERKGKRREGKEREGKEMGGKERKEKGRIGEGRNGEGRK